MTLNLKFPSLNGINFAESKGLTTGSLNIIIHKIVGLKEKSSKQSNYVVILLII